MGVIAVEGMQFYAFHGYYKEEQTLGGKYSVDVYIKTDFLQAAENDLLQKTINYETIFAIAEKEMQQSSKLIEHVGNRILNAIIIEFQNISHIKVRINKFQPPLKGNVDKVYIELEQSFSA
jgi:dihydroneopterin aldolase